MGTEQDADGIIIDIWHQRVIELRADLEVCKSVHLRQFLSDLLAVCEESLADAIKIKLQR